MSLIILGMRAGDGCIWANSKRILSARQLWGRSASSGGWGDNFPLTNFLHPDSLPSASWVAAVLSFHINWGGKKCTRSLFGRNPASWECQLLCLSLFQLAQISAVEQPVWMTRGSILSSDIIRCACGRKSETSVCNSSAMNSTKLVPGTEEAQWKCFADPCLSGTIWDLSLELPTRGGCVCRCLVLIWWVLC